MRSDSTSALALLLSLRTTGTGVAAIGREIALDLADGCYSPDVLEHVPGISNRLPDVLSRRFEPKRSGSQWQLPAALHGVKQAHPPHRGPSFYRCDSAASQAGQEGLESLPP